MISRHFQIFSLSILLFLPSCGNLNSIYRNKKVSDEVSVLSVDAKQRFLVSHERKDDQEKSSVITCTEPSPDVFSVYAAALEAESSKADLLLKLATSENGTTIGLRTEVIQLMRDAMYRLCEAYASGGIQAHEYSSQLARYQKSMVTLIAISQLTNAAMPPSVSLTTSASVANNAKTFEAKNELDKSRQRLTSAEAAQQTATTALEKAKTELKNADDDCKTPVADNVDKCKKYADAKKVKESADANLAKSKNDVSEWQDVYENSKLATTLAASGSAEFSGGSNSTLDPESMRILADSVKGMVSGVYSETVTERCLELALNTNKVRLINSNKSIEQSANIEFKMLEFCSAHLAKLL